MVQHLYEAFVLYPDQFCYSIRNVSALFCMMFVYQFLRKNTLMKERFTSQL